MEQYDVEVLKLLYLIRYVDEIKSNLDNITVLMVDNIETDKITSRQVIQSSLDRLVRNNYVAKNGEIFTFLTDDEQDVTREIKDTPVDSSAIIQSIGKTIFGTIYQNKKFRYGEKYDFAFDKKIDESYVGQPIGAICLRFVTNASEIYSPDDAVFLHHSGAGNEAIIVLSDKYPYFEELEMSMKIRKYVMGKNINTLPDVIKDIIRKRQQQATDYEARATEYITKSLSESRIYVAGEKLNLKISSVKDRIDFALSSLIESVYTKLGCVRKFYNDDSDILKILSGGSGQMLLDGTENPNADAIFEIEQFLSTQAIRHLPTSMNDIHRRFGGIPYGWREVDIAALVAGMIAEKKIVIRYAGNMVLASDRKMPDYLRKKSEIEKAVIESKPVIDAGLLKRVREFLREYFDITDVPMDADDVIVFCIDKFEEEKKSLSDLLANEYSSHNYPDRKIVEEGISLCDALLSQKKDGVLLLKKADELSDDLLDFSDDFSRVKAFFKNQRTVFDSAAKKVSEMDEEKDYLQNEPNASAILSAMRDILRMPKPYQSISKLPDLMKQIDEIYNALLNAKRDEVNNEIQAAMAELHQTADMIKQAEIIGRADSALTAKRYAVDSATRLTALDAMKIQVGTTRQQYMKQLVIPTDETKKVSAVNRSMIAHVATIKNDEDIEEYLEVIRKKLKEKLSDNDMLQII